MLSRMLAVLELLFLLMRGYVNHIVINDIDPAIHAFWWSILNRNEDFCTYWKNRCHDGKLV